MTLPTSNISLSQINTEISVGSSVTNTLGNSAVRSLAGVSSGTISMGDLRGRTQAGSAWISRTSPTTRPIYAVAAEIVTDPNRVGPPWLMALGEATASPGANPNARLLSFDGGYTWDDASGDMNLPATVFYSVIHDGTNWITVGSQGFIYYGGVYTWTQATSNTINRFAGVAAGGGSYVAVGVNGTIRTTTTGNLSTWTARTSGTAQNIEGIAYSASTGLWVAVGTGGTILTSTDTVTWTARTSGILSLLYSVAWGNGLWVAVGSDNVILTSPDGITWTLRTSSVVQTWRSVVYADNTWVVTGESGQVRTSRDGITWVIRNTGISRTLSGVTWSFGQFITVGGGLASGAIQVAPTLNWVTQAQIANTNLTEVAWGNNQWVVLSNTGGIRTSPDAVTWTTRTSGTTRSLNGLAFSSNWTVVGSQGTILTSPDGITWTSRTSGTALGLNSVARSGSQWVAVGNGLVDTDAVILSSSDSVTWTARSSGTRNSLQSVAGSGSLFVAVGISGTILTSPDGVTWTARTSGTIQNLFGVTWNNGLWVAVGNVDTILTSTDGITWTARSINSSFTTQTFNGRSVAWSGYQFIATGTGGTQVITSNNGINWNRESGAFTTSTIESVAWNGTYRTAVSFSSIIATNQV